MDRLAAECGAMKQELEAVRGKCDAAVSRWGVGCGSVTQELEATRGQCALRRSPCGAWFLAEEK